MVDLKPLLFANALALMLLVTAGFATIQRTPELVGSQIPDPEDAAAGLEQPVEPVKPPQQPPEVVEVTREIAPGKTEQSGEAESDDPVAEEPEPEPQFAELSIQSNVDGSAIHINGEKKGSTALQDLRLDPGTHEIEIRKSGHAPWRDQIRLEAGDEQSLSARLQRYTTVEYRDGTWKHGVRTGEGTYRDSDGLHYEGDFVDGEFHGEGVAHFPDGRIYEGDWDEGRMHGEGELQMTNGDVYAGEFRDDEFHGQGTLKAANGDQFSGNWRRGELNGRGTMTTDDGLMYVGEFRNGELHGEGTLTYPDGSNYQGEFARNRYHGEGEKTFASGRRYIGEFVEGRFHGQGEIRHPSGARIESTFRDGDPYGEVELTTPEGEVFTARTSEPGVCYRKNSYRKTQCPPMDGW